MQFNELYPLSSSSLGNAAREGNEKAVKIFLRSGQRVDIGDNRGWTPLHEAASANNTGCLHLLLKKGTIAIAVPCTKIIFQNCYCPMLTSQHEL
jgi:ankyrin repeat protein